MAKHRTHSTEFKRQVAQEFLAGEALHGLAKRHDLSRNLIRVWVAKYESGALDDDVRAAALLQEYEAKIAALEHGWTRRPKQRNGVTGANFRAPLPFVTGGVNPRIDGGGSSVAGVSRRPRWSSMAGWQAL